MALPLQAQACLFRNFLQNLALNQAGPPDAVTGRRAKQNRRGKHTTCFKTDKSKLFPAWIAAAYFILLLGFI